MVVLDVDANNSSSTIVTTINFASIIFVAAITTIIAAVTVFSAYTGSID